MDYDWRTDSLDCWWLALRLIALRNGVARFRTLAEMYWQEQHGVIP